MLHRDAVAQWDGLRLLQEVRLNERQQAAMGSWLRASDLRSFWGKPCEDVSVGHSRQATQTRPGGVGVIAPHAWPVPLAAWVPGGHWAHNTPTAAWRDLKVICL